MTTGICTNLPSQCSKAASKAPISMPTPDTLCPECGSRLQPIAERSAGGLSSTALFAIIVVGVILIAGAVTWLLTGSSRHGHAAPATTASPGAAAPPAGGYLLRLSGSNTIGAVLAPELVRAWLAKQGATSVVSADRTGPDGKSIPETVVNATLNGAPVVVEVKAHGSATAFKDMAAGAADIGMSSRAITDAEVASLQSLGDMRSRASEHVLGLDGVAVIVPASNMISKLSRSDLKRIFSGEVTDWSGVGQPAAPIHLYARDDNSGTYDTFKSLVLEGAPLAAAKRYEDSTKLEADVAADPDGIGFVGMPYVRNTRALAVSDGKAAALEPTRFSVKTENYPLSRRLFLYTASTPSKPAIRDFVEFALSAEGQAVVKAAHFVDLDLSAQSDVSAKEASAAQLPCRLSASWTGDRDEYCKLRASAQQLGTSFRFRTGSAELDNRAAQDLRRVLDRMESSPDKEIVLVGFTDSVGAYAFNCRLSRERAGAVSAALSTLGLKPAELKGYCSELPVRDNDTDTGREQNRRVEIFLK